MIVPFTFLFCFLVVIPLNYGVDLDYFFEEFLRTKDDSCTSRHDELNCQKKCSQRIGLCLAKRCYCLPVSKNNNRTRDHMNLEFKRIDRNNGALHILVNSNPDAHNKVPETQLYPQSLSEDSGVPEYLDESLLIDGSNALRHHIAHFCPNLEVARKCIRSCMMEGKPAFCGKDHICYCGHRYSSNDKDPEFNVSSVYGQFKDLYAKYFGPGYSPDIDV